MGNFLIQLDESYLRRAIRLAMNGRGRVEPNPMVACLLVNRAGKVIGEGFHAQLGGPHAEPTALASCTESPAGATAYVTLEPCCHTDKKTPPCVPALIAAKVGRVVVGCVDPNPSVDGQGLAQLRQAGIEVAAPVVEGEAKQLLAPFIATTVRGRPYVTLKWAQTLNGKVGGPGGKRMLITNDVSHRVLHDLRGRCDAILVGIGTVLTDDPLLTARPSEFTPRPLQRVVVDSELRTPVTSQLAQTIAHGPLTIYCKQAVHDRKYALVAALMSAGAKVTGVPADSADNVSMAHVLGDLAAKGVQHLLVEPGPTLAKHFLDANLVDRVWVFQSPNRLDDDTAPDACPVTYPATGRVEIAGDMLTESLNPGSDVFFAPVASADFVGVYEAMRSPSGPLSRYSGRGLG
ncbi:MAG: bifunctional diaminohydroxyphosphoribosylaminopyrimidine deaminase/5-amino-6-(5-phosphoribosylamino)uracil reductase RibD [Tepidisphaeraceae bacterium]